MVQLLLFLPFIILFVGVGLELFLSECNLIFTLYGAQAGDDWLLSSPFGGVIQQLSGKSGRNLSWYYFIYPEWGYSIFSCSGERILWEKNTSLTASFNLWTSSETGNSALEKKEVSRTSWDLLPFSSSLPGFAAPRSSARRPSQPIFLYLYRCHGYWSVIKSPSFSLWWAWCGRSYRIPPTPTPWLTLGFRSFQTCKLTNESSFWIPQFKEPGIWDCEGTQDAGC